MSDTVEVSADFLSPRSSSEQRACEVCGAPLTYSGKGRPPTRCESCKTTNTPSTPRAAKRKTSVTSKNVEAKLNSVTARVLVSLTLMWAWSQLRQRHIPDPQMQIATQLSFTDEEAVDIGKPLTRLLLKMDPIAKAAPHIIDNEDIVTAVFALWDWYRRTSDVLDAYGKQHLPSPPVTVVRGRHARKDTVNGNGPTRQNAADQEASSARERFDSDYIPPAPTDYLG